MYCDKMVEIITEEVLCKQEFEVWIPRAVICEEDFLTIRHLPELDEDSLRRHYYFYCRVGSIKEEDLSLEQYISNHKRKHENYIQNEKNRIKATTVFLDDQLNSFKEYLRSLESESIKFNCDFVAKKDRKIYIIQVKSTKGALQFLRGKRLKGLLLAREFGFIPTLISFDIKIEANNFKIEEV